MEAGRHRRRWGTGMALMVALLGVSAWIWWPQERLLLPQATWVTSTAIVSDHAMQVRDGYLWISGHEVLFFRGYWTPGDLRLFERDLATGEDRLLKPLSTLFNHSFVRHIQQRISPDGKWLLWQGERLDLQVATLDGSHYLRWPTAGGYDVDEVLWTRDSRHLIEFVRAQTGVPTAVLYSLDRPRTVVKIPIPPANPLSGNRYPQAFPAVVVSECMIYRRGNDG